MQINTNILSNLTPEEKELFAILKEVVNKYAPYVTCRVAGGWVRDRLLGKESDDIDIMVDKISGAEFARLVTQYLNVKDPHVVKANPDASKHMETAGADIPLPSGKNIDVDFAMARKEVYNNDSRIPDIKPATAQEDAERRDLTINSCFFNINTGQIEDFTGKGIKDIITNTIRTPLDPLITFRDDPLRIFRCLRFSAKYNWNIDHDTYNAMLDPNLKNDIKRKISKERIKDEIVKMLKGPNPLVAINLLKQTGLFEDIITEAIKGSKFESKLMNLDMNQNNPNHDLTLWDHTVEVIKNVINQYPNSDDEKRVVMILSALMHDLGKLYSDVQTTKDNRTQYIGHENESSLLSQLILKYLKFENTLIEEVAKITESHMVPHSLLNSNQTTLRRFIRNMSEKSLNWLDVLNHAISDAYSKGKIVDQATINDYNQLKQKLEEAYQSMKVEKKKVIPVLNGFEIMKLLNVKPGPIISTVNEYLKELQDENPNVTKEEASEKIKMKFLKQDQNSN